MPFRRFQHNSYPQQLPLFRGRRTQSRLQNTAISRPQPHFHDIRYHAILNHGAKHRDSAIMTRSLQIVGTSPRLEHTSVPWMCPNGLWQAQKHSGREATREYDPCEAQGPPTDFETAMSRMHLPERDKHGLDQKVFNFAQTRNGEILKLAVSSFDLGDLKSSMG